MTSTPETTVEPLLPPTENDSEWRSCSLNDGKSAKTVEQATATRKLTIAIILCFIFMIVELIGGWLASSLAIMSDAAHLLSDVGGFVVSLVALKLARSQSPQMTYGFARAEVLGALLSVVTIWMVTGMLVAEAVQRIISPEDVDGKRAHPTPPHPTPANLTPTTTKPHFTPPHDTSNPNITSPQLLPPHLTSLHATTPLCTYHTTLCTKS